jgi:hypothetical protein
MKNGAVANEDETTINWITRCSRGERPSAIVGIQLLAAGSKADPHRDNYAPGKKRGRNEVDDEADRHQ